MLLQQYNEAELSKLFNRLEEYIRAIIVDINSPHVEDAVHVRNLREALIKSILAGEFNIAIPPRPATGLDPTWPGDLGGDKFDQD